MIWGREAKAMNDLVHVHQDSISHLIKEIGAIKDRIDRLMTALDLVEVKREAVPTQTIIKKKVDLTEAEKKPLITAEDLQRNIAVNPYENTGVQAGNFLKRYL